MKTIITFRSALLFVCALSLTQLTGQSDEPTGLLGDNFSLESTLEVFKNAKSLEAFEEAINKEDNRVHNLDLNGDGKIDYITVNDYMDGDVHAIALSALINEDEAQDIAVIEIEKTGKESATLQIVGDEDLYGKDMIVEPFDDVESDEGQGPEVNLEVDRIIINVWPWTSVKFIYAPDYVVYNTRWRWSYYPRWWSPWQPLGWQVWRPYSVRHVHRYHITPVRRVTHARVVYAPKRKVSRTVTVRHTNSIAKARTTNISTRKSRTTVAGVKTKNGKAVGVKKTRTKVNTPAGTKTKTKTKIGATNGKKTVKGAKTTKKVKKKGGIKKSTKKTKKVKKKKGG